MGRGGKILQVLKVLKTHLLVLLALTPGITGPPHSSPAPTGMEPQLLLRGVAVTTGDTPSCPVAVLPAEATSQEASCVHSVLCPFTINALISTQDTVSKPSGSRSLNFCPGVTLTHGFVIRAPVNVTPACR